MDSKFAFLILIIGVVFGGMIMYDKKVEANYYSVCDINRLDECEPSQAYTMLLENTGDKLVTQNSTARPAFDINFILVLRQSDGITFRVPHLVRSSLLTENKCKYIGKMRPYLKCNGTAGTFDGFYIETKSDPMSPEQEIRDLNKAIGNETNLVLLARYTFYLAFAYERNGDYKKAIHYYGERRLLGGWPPEVFYSQYREAIAYLRMNDTKSAKTSLLDAYALDPNRKEPLYYLARIAREENDLPLCMLYTGAGMQLGVAWTNALFVETDIYLWRLEEERALCLYYTNRKNDAKFHWNRLMHNPMVPKGDKERVKKSLTFV